MKTARDAFAAWDEGGKVIDLNAWRAANQDRFRSGRDEAPEFVPRPRRNHRPSMPAAELAATLSVVAVALALIMRILTF